jgi:hypothetical protein
LNKQEIIAQLKRHLTDVPQLRALNYANAEFPRWKNGVLKTLTDIYGSDSPQYKRFEDAPGKFFKVDTETGRQQSYTYVLEMHESALNTLISRAEMS